MSGFEHTKPNTYFSPQTSDQKPASGLHERESIEQIVNLAQSNLFNLQNADHCWNFHAHLGLHFISQYFLFNKWFAHSHSRLDSARLIKLILESQRSDGSWVQINNSSAQPSDLNASIFNYWALKVFGFAEMDKVMVSARNYILNAGGIAASAHFTKIILALFNNYPWSQIPTIPYLLFNDHLPISHRDFSQWAVPHLMAIAFLRNNNVAKSLGANFELSELYVKATPVHNESSRLKFLLGPDSHLIRKLIATQQPKGSWGGYTLSTLLSMMALQDYQNRQGDYIDTKLSLAIARGFRFVEDLYFSEGPQYKGALMDGRFWDTILAGSCLLDSGAPSKKLEQVAHYVAGIQQECGGFPYGEDFEYAPDVDDTAEAVLFLLHFRRVYRDKIEKSISWLISMQNDDGGWGAFDRNNQAHPLLKFLTRDFEDSVDLFDDSSADLTGHVLEALGATGLNTTNSETIRKAVRYLKDTQEPDGSWMGRWGINYLYGTACALTGLCRASEDLAAPYIKKAVNWFSDKQNPDGGFGESPDSYVSKGGAGRGMSTPSQTAWVLIALCHAGKGLSPAAYLASDYLVREFKAEGKWIDKFAVGTGHPGILYMNYPSYQYTFPLFALSAYLKCLAAYEHDSSYSRRSSKEQST